MKSMKSQRNNKKLLLGVGWGRGLGWGGGGGWGGVGEGVGVGWGREGNPHNPSNGSVSGTTKQV